MQTGVGVLLQMAKQQLVGKAYEAHRLQGLGTYRKHRALHEHDGFGKGVAGGNDVDDLLLAVGGNPVELDLPALYLIEALGRIALALDQTLRRALPYLGIGQQLLLRLLIEMGKRWMIQNQSALFLCRDHGCSSFDELGRDAPCSAASWLHYKASSVLGADRSTIRASLDMRQSGTQLKGVVCGPSARHVPEHAFHVRSNQLGRGSDPPLRQGRTALHCLPAGCPIQ